VQCTEAEHWSNSRDHLDPGKPGTPGVVTEAPGTPGIDVVVPVACEAPEVVAVVLGTVAVAPFTPGTVAVVPFTPGTVAVAPFTPGIAVVVSLTPGTVAVVVAVLGTEVVEVVPLGTVVDFNPSSAFSLFFSAVCPRASEDAAPQLSAAIVTAIIGFMALSHVCQTTCNKASSFVTRGH
jgi:hypothetical protein